MNSNLTCEFCDYSPEPNEYFDKAEDGWWCDDCDAFNFYEKKREESDRFVVLLEDKALKEPPRMVLDKKFKKNLSPLRYPGGKSKLIDYLYTHLSEKKCNTLYSAYTGGGSFELAMLEAGVVNKLVMNDIDFGVYSLWWTMLYAPFALIDLIENKTPSSEDYYTGQQHLKNDCRGLTMTEAAWHTLVVNRLAYSGIPNANHLGGKHGSSKQMLSRWNPKTLINRIKAIHKLSDNIEIHCGDAISFIEEAYWSGETIFIDPPYISKGKILYNHYYNQDQHYRLSNVLDILYWSFSGSDIIVTYDNHQLTQELFNMATECKVIGRNYSI